MWSMYSVSDGRYLRFGKKTTTSASKKLKEKRKMKREVMILILGAAILLGYNSFAVDLYPTVDVTQPKADAAVWVVCLLNGFTYDDGGVTTGLDASTLTFDGEGNPDWSSVVQANWPAGQATAMQNFYKNYLNNLLKSVAGQAAYISQNLNQKTPNELSGTF